MKPLLIAAGLALFACAPGIARAVPGCAVFVQSQVELTGPDLSLADLLAPDSCPKWLRAARQVALGRAPLLGSARVLDGAEVRAMLVRIAPPAQPISVRVPERIRVIRGGARAACADLQPRISPPAGPAVECGAGGRIGRDAPLVVGTPVWDAALARWTVIARCARPGDCVPFLLELSGAAPPSDRSPRAADLARSSGARIDSEPPVMRPGQAVILVWDQDGIRFTGRATCLDRGRAGDFVRARITPGGRVVHAVVVNSAMLRTGS